VQGAVDIDRVKLPINVGLTTCLCEMSMHREIQMLKGMPMPKDKGSKL
jgi:hypothetical protein